MSQLTIQQSAEAAIVYARTNYPNNAYLMELAFNLEQSLLPNNWRDRDWNGESICSRLGEGGGLIDGTIRWNLAGCDVWASGVSEASAQLSNALANAGDTIGSQLAASVTNEVEETKTNKPYKNEIRIGLGLVGLWLGVRLIEGVGVFK